MKTRFVLPLLVLALFSLPAMAQQLYSTGGPEFPSPVGEDITMATGNIVDSSWVCAFQDCDVTGVTFWIANTTPGGGNPVPTSISWLLSGAVPFNFKAGVSGTSTSIFQIGSCMIGEGGTPFCLESVNFGRSIDVPGGLNWFNLYNEVDASGGAIIWSTANGTGQPSSTLVLTPSGSIIQVGPPGQAFAVFGTPTTPEPGSILLLGSGLLGVAAVLRRKLMR